MQANDKCAKRACVEHDLHEGRVAYHDYEIGTTRDAATADDNELTATTTITTINNNNNNEDCDDESSFGFQFMPKCPLCEKTFANSSNLKHHMNTIHFNEAKWICVECGKVCTSKSNLKVHLRVHLRVKPYYCRWCDYNCMHHSSIRDHLSKFHPEKSHNSCEPGYLFNSAAVPEPQLSQPMSMSATHVRAKPLCQSTSSSSSSSSSKTNTSADEPHTPKVRLRATHKSLKSADYAQHDLERNNQEAAASVGDPHRRRGDELAPSSSQSHLLQQQAESAFMPSSSSSVYEKVEAAAAAQPPTHAPSPLFMPNGHFMQFPIYPANIQPQQNTAAATLADATSGHDLSGGSSSSSFRESYKQQQQQQHSPFDFSSAASIMSLPENVAAFIQRLNMVAILKNYTSHNENNNNNNSKNTSTNSNQASAFFDERREVSSAISSAPHAKPNEMKTTTTPPTGSGHFRREKLCASSSRRETHSPPPQQQSPSLSPISAVSSSVAKYVSSSSPSLSVDSSASSASSSNSTNVNGNGQPANMLKKTQHQNSPFHHHQHPNYRQHHRHRHHQEIFYNDDENNNDNDDDDNDDDDNNEDDSDETCATKKSKTLSGAAAVRKQPTEAKNISMVIERLSSNLFSKHDTLTHDSTTPSATCNNNNNKRQLHYNEHSIGAMKREHVDDDDNDENGDHHDDNEEEEDDADNDDVALSVTKHERRASVLANIAAVTANANIGNSLFASAGWTPSHINGHQYANANPYANVSGGGASYKCTYCNIMFDEYSLYSIHAGMHSAADPWQCNVCNHKTANKIDFAVHILHLSKI